MVHIFLSDVHLGAFENSRNQHLEYELTGLVDYCESRNIQIHILGDFFDYWMEFPDYIPDVGRSILDRFEKYNRTMGNKTTYITGNHDYWTESHFENRGFHVEHEFLNLQLGKNNIFLCHGDGLSAKQFQLSRPCFHRCIRNPKFVTLYKKAFSGKKGLQLMKSFSSSIRDEKHVDTARLTKWAKFMIEKFSYNVVISGHDHIPRLETFPEGSYMNTGAFYKYKTLLKYNKGVFKLVTWNNGINEFQPFLQ